VTLSSPHDHTPRQLASSLACGRGLAVQANNMQPTDRWKTHKIFQPTGMRLSLGNEGQRGDAECI